MNAFTTVLGDRMKGDLQKFARLTIQLSDLLWPPQASVPRSRSPCPPEEQPMAPGERAGPAQEKGEQISEPVAIAGLDPRRHVFTHEQRSRGGRTIARRHLHGQTAP